MHLLACRYVQIMPMDTDPAQLGFDPLDDTKVCRGPCPRTYLGWHADLALASCCSSVHIQHAVFNVQKA